MLTQMVPLLARNGAFSTNGEVELTLVGYMSIPRKRARYTGTQRNGNETNQTRNDKIFETSNGCAR